MTEVGYHECFIASVPRESDTRVVAWTQEGLAAGELVVRIEPPGHDGAFLRLLERHGIDVRSVLQAGQLVVQSPEDTYLVDGLFDPARRAERDAALIGQSIAAGYAAVRVSGDAAWPSALAPTPAELFSHEASVEALSRTHPLRVLCLYDRADLEAALPSFVHTHPRAVTDRLVRIATQHDRLTIAGEIDISNIELFAGVLRAWDPDAGDVIVDMHAATFIDARGVAELVRFARRRDPGHRVTVLDPPPSLRKVTAVLGAGALEVQTAAGLHNGQQQPPTTPG